MNGFTYIEIISLKTKEVIKRIDVSDRSEMQINRAIIGIEINLNADKYFVAVKHSAIELELFSN